jgi:hypothetical protein
MITNIDVEILIGKLYEELDEVSKKHLELKEKLEIVQAYGKTLDGFVCNMPFILNTLCEAAKNEQRANSIYHFVELITNEVLKGENNAGNS